MVTLKECKTEDAKTKCNRCKGRSKKNGEDHVEDGESML
jgi:hypothetical protein